MKHPRHSRGAALLVAMLTVTLVATFAAASMWQQWRNVEIESADRERVQSSWILTGALDWARLILREDRNGFDYIGEPWSVPLQEARLTTFLAADPTTGVMQSDDPDNVFLSGDITDLQSRLNVNNLVRAGSRNQEAEEAFRRLFEVLGLPQAQFTQMVENLRFASDISVDNLNAARAPLPPHRVEQLAWLGLSPETVAALAPYVTFLPASNTLVNLNTAPAEVIYAVGKNISLADAQRLIAARESHFFSSMTDVSPHLPQTGSFIANTTSFGSSYFEIRGRLRIDDTVIEERSVVQRQVLGGVVVTIHRERGAPETPAPRLTQR